MSDRLPVFVITGFLGAGKTTVLNRLLDDPDMADTAVIINEFGEVGLDHLLVEAAVDGVVLMQSGCLCCTIRGDLVDTLNDLIGRRDKGALPAFSRVVVETTGLADPVPVLQTLLAGRGVTDRFRAGGVVTVVDALHGAVQLDDTPEPARQVAVADVLILSKIDLVADGGRRDVVARLRALNPAAPIHPVVDGRIGPDALFAAGPFDVGSKSSDVRAWLGAMPDGHDHAAHGHDVNRHGPDIHTFCLALDTPVDWSGFATWLQSVVSLRGSDILRIKGIVDVAGFERPVIIHGVRHVVHPPVVLDRWPDGERGTRIVFICRGLDPADLRAALDAALHGGRRTAPRLSAATA